MKRFLFRAAALSFAVCVLTLAVLHGCSKPQPVVAPTSAAAPGVTSGAAPSAAQTAAQETVEEDPAYLGATKAAVIVRPKAAKAKPAANQK